MRILPFMAFSLVHPAGLRSIPCFRSLKAPSARFLARYSSMTFSAVSGRFVRSTNDPSLPVTMRSTAWSVARSFEKQSRGNVYDSLVSTKQSEFLYLFLGLLPESMFFRMVSVPSQSRSALRLYLARIPAFSFSFLNMYQPCDIADGGPQR